MDPATRNLYRAAKPTFRLDGTPQVTIRLSHVASGLGEPMQTHKPRLDPTCLG